MTEVVKFFMEPAAFPGPDVSQRVVERTESLSQCIVTLQKLSCPSVDLSGARVPLHDNCDPDTPAAGLLEGRRQPLIPEIIGHPEDFSTRRHFMNAFFKEVTQAAGWAVRTSPENLEWLRQRHIISLNGGD
jgi:hypothetical protein